MPVKPEDRLLGAIEELASGDVVREVEAQGQNVHETADERLGLHQMASEVGCADPNLVFTRVSLEKRSERREQDPVGSGTLLPAKLTEITCQGVRKSESSGQNF